ncbi:hypothetical protein SETIT_5G432400v2 [Setaria italica]|uniref:Uncharacterized protein n=1 Tax=Setaria italica TaxID=4555 RepID=K3XHG6_SETIT|nr:hypothetical protein SETIT_5G432400v2 [Setaria italica]
MPWPWSACGSVHLLGEEGAEPEQPLRRVPFLGGALRAPRVVPAAGRGRGHARRRLVVVCGFGGGGCGRGGGGLLLGAGLLLLRGGLLQLVAPQLPHGAGAPDADAGAAGARVVVTALAGHQPPQHGGGAVASGGCGGGGQRHRLGGRSIFFCCRWFCCCCGGGDSSCNRGGRGNGRRRPGGLSAGVAAGARGAAHLARGWRRGRRRARGAGIGISTRIGVGTGAGVGVGILIWLGPAQGACCCRAAGGVAGGAAPGEGPDVDVDELGVPADAAHAALHLLAVLGLAAARLEDVLPLERDRREVRRRRDAGLRERLRGLLPFRSRLWHRDLRGVRRVLEVRILGVGLGALGVAFSGSNVAIGGGRLEGVEREHDAAGEELVGGEQGRGRERGRVPAHHPELELRRRGRGRRRPPGLDAALRRRRRKRLHGVRHCYCPLRQQQRKPPADSGKRKRRPGSVSHSRRRR